MHFLLKDYCTDQNRWKLDKYLKNMEGVKILLPIVQELF